MAGAAERIASMAIWTLPEVPFLKPTGQERPRGQLAVHLALGGARADGAPADQVGDILRRDQVEELGPGRHAHLGKVEQQTARAMRRPSLMRKRLVEMRVVDQALPADRGARLLEVDAHDDERSCASSAATA